MDWVCPLLNHNSYLIKLTVEVNRVNTKFGKLSQSDVQMVSFNIGTTVLPLSRT